MANPCPPSADSVSFIDRCPLNSSEWNQRALQKNCSIYPQTCFKPLEYHCLLNPYGNESLEVCAPNTWLAEDFCPSYNIKEQRILEQFNCTLLISDCPRRQYFSRTILDYKGCVEELHGLTISVPNLTPSTVANYTSATPHDTPVDDNLLWLAPITITLVIILFTLSFMYCCWRKGSQQKRNMEMQDRVGDVNNSSNPDAPLLSEIDERIDADIGRANNTDDTNRLSSSTKYTEDCVEINVEPDQLRQYLNKGELTFYHARGIIVGCGGAGKTTLMKRLMDTPIEQPNETKSTEVVDVHVNAFLVLEDTMQAINADQNQPILQFSKEDIIRGEFNRKADEIEIEQNIKPYRHEKPSADHFESQTSKKFTSVTQTIPLNSNGLAQPFDCSETTLSTAIKDDAEESNGNIENNEDNIDHEEHEHPEDTAKVETNIDMAGIMDAVQKLSRESNERRTITFLDFAGQSIYYAFHQIYLSSATFSILVVDMRKNHEDICEATHVSDADFCCSRFDSWTYKEFYRFWLRSIDSFCGTETPVIVVGTHAEDKSEQDCANFFNSFIGLFHIDEDFHLRRHLHTNRCFAIKLPRPEKGESLEELSTLKTTIIDLVTNQLYWKRTVKPTSAILEHILQEYKDRRVINKKILLDHNELLSAEFRLNNSELTTLLKHLHEAGTLLYFEEPALKDTIILDVQWLVQAFKSIIAYNVATKNRDDIERQKFHETGELNNEDFDAIWKRQQIEGKDFIAHKDVLTSYMEKLGLLAVFNSEGQLWFYFPSMNRRKFDHKQFKDFKKSSVLSFQFEKEKQLPIFVFHSFVIKCMKLPLWKIHTNRRRRCIYDEVACFSFRGHIVLLCVFNFQIQVQVCHRDNDIETNLLKEIKSMLENTMEEFRNQNYNFDIGYKCQYGKFHDEELNFITEKYLMNLTNTDGKSLCEFCPKPHELGDGIYWAIPVQKQRHSEEAQSLIGANILLSIECGHYEDELCCITCLPDGRFWLTGHEETMRLYDPVGKLIKEIKTTSNEWPWDITSNEKSELLYCDHYERSVNILKTIDGKLETMMKFLEWKPRCLCCTVDGDLLVLMDDNRFEETKIVRYSGCKEKQTIQWDENNYPFFTSGFNNVKYICENKNSDICVSDNKGQAIVAILPNGKLQFRYEGSNKRFSPIGIATDMHCRILTADKRNNCIHIISKIGHLLSLIDTCDLHRPSGLCVDSQHNILVVERQRIVKKIQYYDPNRELDERIDADIRRANNTDDADRLSSSTRCIEEEAQSLIGANILLKIVCGHYEDELCCITCLPDGRFWLTGHEETMRLYDPVGKLIKEIKTTSNEWPWDITSNEKSELLYCDHYERSVNILQTIDGKIETMIKLLEWKPRCLCCTADGDLLVLMDDNRFEETKIVRYSGCKEKQTIQWDENNYPFFTSGFNNVKYICENKNSDICVSDNKGQAIVAILPNGKLHFRYEGSNKRFSPIGIATDMHCRILTADLHNNCIHIISKIGKLHSVIDTCDLHRPSGLCVDSQDNILVVEKQRIVKKIQYYDSE